MPDTNEGMKNDERLTSERMNERLNERLNERVNDGRVRGKEDIVLSFGT